MLSNMVTVEEVDEELHHEVGAAGGGFSRTECTAGGGGVRQAGAGGARRDLHRPRHAGCPHLCGVRQRAWFRACPRVLPSHVCAAAENAIKTLNGRLFAGRIIAAVTFSEEKFKRRDFALSSSF